jgi:hypothetical protein
MLEEMQHERLMLFKAILLDEWYGLPDTKLEVTPQYASIPSCFMAYPLRHKRIHSPTCPMKPPCAGFATA